MIPRNGDEQKIITKSYPDLLLHVCKKYFTFQAPLHDNYHHICNNDHPPANHGLYKVEFL